MNRPASIAKLEQQVAAFNRAVPEGSRVQVRMDSGEIRVTTTRSPAQVLAGHTAVVWLDGIQGCYLLDRVSAVGSVPPPAIPTAPPAPAEHPDYAAGREAYRRRQGLFSGMREREGEAMEQFVKGWMEDANTAISEPRKAG